jgi:hypothetical protein
MARSLTRREDWPRDAVGVRRPGGDLLPHGYPAGSSPCSAAETVGLSSPAAAMTRYRIVRDDGQPDTIAGQRFATYDAAYAVLERYYGDLCCSDEREYYSIEEDSAAEDLADGQPG